MALTGYPTKSARPLWCATLAFDPNGTSDSASSTWTGSLARYVTSITYSATGKHTIVFNEDFTPANAPIWLTSQVIDSLAEAFVTMQLDAYVAATRTLVVQTCSHDGSATTALVGKAVAAPGAAGNAKVIIHCRVEQTTGK